MILATIALTLVMPSAPVKKVLVIGIDGCRPDALSKAATPHVDSLIRNGCWAVGKSDPLTLSGPCWSTVLCGVWAGKHGVTDNNFVGANYKEYPDFLTLLERFKPSLRTVAFAEWKLVLDKIVQMADFESSARGEGDEAIALEAAAQISDLDPDVVFVQFGAVDAAGHSFGFGPAVPQYLKSIEETDKNVGLLLAAVQSRKKILDEDWLVVLTSDHGGSGTSHGQAVSEHMNVPFIVSGPSAAEGFDVIPTLVDIAPTVFAHLGIARGDEVDWDGVPVGLKGVDSDALAKKRDFGTVRFAPSDGFLFGKETLPLRVGYHQAVARFTVDGSPPTGHSFSGSEIALEKSGLVRARAFSDKDPIGPSTMIYVTVQKEYLRAVTPRDAVPGLHYRVVRRAYSSVVGVDFSKPDASGIAGTPSSHVGASENFAVTFDGLIKISEQGVYQFGLYCDDGAVLTIGDRVVVDHDGSHTASMKTGFVALSAGWHSFRLDYFQAGGDSALSLAMGLRGHKMVEVKPSMFGH